MLWNLILKCPRFVPFDGNLAQNEAKSDIPGEKMWYNEVRKIESRNSFNKLHEIWLKI